jgi:hypothetical protein
LFQGLQWMPETTHSTKPTRSVVFPMHMYLW